MRRAINEARKANEQMPDEKDDEYNKNLAKGAKATLKARYTRYIKEWKETWQPQSKGAMEAEKPDAPKTPKEWVKIAHAKNDRHIDVYVITVLAAA